MNPQGKSGVEVSPGGVAVIEHIGHTPLVRLQRVGREYPQVEFSAKAEWFNPGGSVKDRPALNMILEGERSGKLQRGRIIMDATSGNTGIAYALIGAARGYKVRLCLPANASLERKRILAAYGAELILTDPAEGSDGAIRMARKLYAEHPELYFYPDQYSNPANWQAHYQGTAAEIWEQTGGRITHFVAGLGTSGTFVGCARLVKRLAREEGLLVGVSSGAALWGALEVARRIPRSGSAVLVMIFPDSGDKYLSERFWDED